MRVGGGGNHRFGLDDAVLIKDNHVAIAGGVTEALRRARKNVGHMVKIEVEVDLLAQLAEALGPASMPSFSTICARHAGARRSRWSADGRSPKPQAA